MATAQPTVDAAPKKGRSKKLLIIVLAAVLVLGGIGGGALFYIKKKQAAQLEAEAEEGGEETAASSKPKARDGKRDLTAKPVFVPLELFTVNLADREADRYAQIAITLEMVDEKSQETIKNFMPIIRNSILMTLTYKTSADLLERGGKAKLAAELRRDISRSLGLQVPDDPLFAASGGASGVAGSPAPRRKPLKPEEITPIAAVHFSNFIIQ